MRVFRQLGGAQKGGYLDHQFGSVGFKVHHLEMGLSPEKLKPGWLHNPQGKVTCPEPMKYTLNFLFDRPNGISKWRKVAKLETG